MATTQTLFETFLLELAKVLNFSTLAPDKQGACLVVMKADNISLLFEFDDQIVENTILLSTSIAPISKEHEIDLCEACLIGNISMEEILSMRPDEGSIYLHRRVHPDISSNNLEVIINTFCQQVNHWKKKVEEIVTKPAKHLKATSAIGIMSHKV